MSVRTAAGTTLHIAVAAPATYDGTGYAALTWIKVGEITSIGEYGREYTEVTHQPLDSRGVQKLKGGYNEGTLPIGLALDTDDVGQIAMKAARNSDNAISAKVTHQNGDVDYMRTMVFSFKVNPGELNSIVNASASLGITTNSAGVGIVEVLAA
ncbi:hypothetical protein [Sphingomonas sp. SRS2]|uniref:hypothetical protein n=1 Tax=Sphingomonas sp. SRS2 TaxID=133190 RepID=UPI00061845CA|nr:hypothetical protein [Sphingomonas sp. SRS2]KKC27303.1 hypothetical protein WP12_03920 [Sphingomonas sp. SRS2]